MEKLLRYLNPKTVNFDAMPSGGVPSLTAADVCIMMSYAKLTPMQDNLVRLKCLGANTPDNVEQLAKRLVQKYIDQFRFKNVSSEYYESVIRTALIEFCMVPASYSNSVRNRAVLAGVHYLVVHRYLNESITEVFEDLEREFAIANDKLIFQLNKTN